MTFVPRVLAVNPLAQHNMEKIISNVMRQVSVMRKSYDETIHGRFRAVISFGTYYIVTTTTDPPKNITEEEFDSKVSHKIPKGTAGLVNPDHRREGVRGNRHRLPTFGRASSCHRDYNAFSAETRGPGSVSPRYPYTARGKMADTFLGQGIRYQRSVFGNHNPHLRIQLNPQYSQTYDAARTNYVDTDTLKEEKTLHQTSWRHAFIPAANHNFVDKKLAVFLKENRFVLADEMKEYRVTVKLKMSDYLSNIDGIILLDEDFRLNGLTLPDIKWQCVNIITNKPPGESAQVAPYDVRFKIHSRVHVTSLEMSRRIEDCDDLIKNHRTLLRRNEQGTVVGVHPDYKDRIRYMRYKDVKTYELEGNLQQPTTDKFLHGMKIRINHGMECSRPDRDGTFRDVDGGRTEITVIPVLPDLTDDVKMIAFLTRMWTFAKEFGLLLT
jgi:hypothetical protein